MGFDLTKSGSKFTGTLEKYFFNKKWWPYVLILLGILLVVVMLAKTPAKPLFP